MEQKLKKILVLFYSTYGHVETMARKIKEGAEMVSGIKVDLLI